MTTTIPSFERFPPRTAAPKVGANRRCWLKGDGERTAAFQQQGVWMLLVDEQALLARAFELYSGRLFAYALRHTRSVAFAEDVAQDAFLALASAGRRGFPPEDEAESWLFLVARRRLIDERRRARFAAGDLSEADEVAAPRDEDATRQSVELVRRVRALPPAERQVVVLHLLQGRRFEEIAAALSTTPMACRAVFSRAVARLRTGLDAAGLRPHYES
jgi:RNA polymerase sigma-70 factor (ECF subfamily)